MKKLIMMFLLAGVVFAGGSVYESYVHFNEVMASGENVLSVFKKRRMDIVKVDIGRVSPVVSENVYKDLDKGYTYFISVAGQRSRIENLRAWVYLMDTTGKEILVGQDTTKGKYPNIQVTPVESGTYKVVVRVTSMVAGCTEGYYFMAIGAIKL
jgi:hypothetical protein